MSNTRDQYVAKMKSKLDQWNAEIDELQAKAKQAEGKASERLNDHLSDLRQKRDDVQARLKDLGDSSEKSWEQLREGIDRIGDEIGSTLKSTRDAFKS